MTDVVAVGNEACLEEHSEERQEEADVFETSLLTESARIRRSHLLLEEGFQDVVEALLLEELLGPVRFELIDELGFFSFFNCLCRVLS